LVGDFLVVDGQPAWTSAGWAMETPGRGADPVEPRREKTGPVMDARGPRGIWKGGAPTSKPNVRPSNFEISGRAGTKKPSVWGMGVVRGGPVLFVGAFSGTDRVSSSRFSG